uniref:Putative Rgk3-like protein n=1 Tax=Mayetiola destructor TaxID=39758 RepID=F6KPR1_MAYDE|nr:putative Rgk3-like protein [Mayetiola destructor]
MTEDSLRVICGWGERDMFKNNCKIERAQCVIMMSQRKSNAYLDVPSANFNHLQISDNDDEDVDRLRTFSASKGGVINRGDSFRRKRSRSNSLANSPMSPNQSPSVSNPSRSFGPVDSYRVNMLGGPGVGKTALISQFCTSECINAYEDTGLYINI